MGDQPQKLFHLPGTIEEENENDEEISIGPDNLRRPESPLLNQSSNIIIVPSLPTNLTISRVSTQASNIGRQDSARYRAGPVRKFRRRAVLKNGECNVLKSKVSQRSIRYLQDIFTTLVDSQWRWTLLCFALSFFLSWLIFASLWWLIAFTHGDFDPRHQDDNEWRPCVSELHSFTSCFLFSIETQHTIGYGGRATTEECPEAIFLMFMQSVSGVMIQAFMVGIVFAKMSRPKQRSQTLLFSKNAVVCQRDGELCLIFRVGDMRKSHIIGASVKAQVIKTRTTKEGEIIPYSQQELAVAADGQNDSIFFIWPITVVHKINGESPFYNMSAGDMLLERFEIVVFLEGTIESTGQSTQARSSYLSQEVLWGHRFEPMVKYSKERQGYEVDYSLFNLIVQVDTPLCSARELAEFYKVQDEIRSGNAGYPFNNGYHHSSNACQQKIHRSRSSSSIFHYRRQQQQQHYLRQQSSNKPHSVKSLSSFEDIPSTSSRFRNTRASEIISLQEKSNQNGYEIIEIDPGDANDIAGESDGSRNGGWIVGTEFYDQKHDESERSLLETDFGFKNNSNHSSRLRNLKHPSNGHLNHHKSKLHSPSDSDDQMSINKSSKHTDNSKKYFLLALKKSHDNKVLCASDSRVDFCDKKCQAIANNDVRSNIEYRTKKELIENKRYRRPSRSSKEFSDSNFWNDLSPESGFEGSAVSSPVDIDGASTYASSPSTEQIHNSSNNNSNNFKDTFQQNNSGNESINSSSSESDTSLRSNNNRSHSFSQQTKMTSYTSV